VVLMHAVLTCTVLTCAVLLYPVRTYTVPTHTVRTYAVLLCMLCCYACCAAQMVGHGVKAIGGSIIHAPGASAQLAWQATDASKQLLGHGEWAPSVASEESVVQ
jgi:hypothetical protein